MENMTITSWQVNQSNPINSFDQMQNVGLFQLAQHTNTERDLLTLAEKRSTVKNVAIEFMPERMGSGPRKPFMCYEPSGIRIEFTWMGN